MLIKASQSCLLIVDVQSKLLPAVNNPDAVVRGCRKLLRGAARLGIPVLISEHCPTKIGPTVPALMELAQEDWKILEKTHFSCVAEPSLAQHFHALGRPQVVVAGTEAHVCVLQTVLDLKQVGLIPIVVQDACGSRRDLDANVAMDRIRSVGVTVVTVEMVLFEWLHRADTPEFRDVLRMITE